MTHTSPHQWLTTCHVLKQLVAHEDRGPHVLWEWKARVASLQPPPSSHPHISPQNWDIQRICTSESLQKTCPKSTSFSFTLLYWDSLRFNLPNTSLTSGYLYHSFLYKSPNFIFALENSILKSWVLKTVGSVAIFLFIFGSSNLVFFFSTLRVCFLFGLEPLQW